MATLSLPDVAYVRECVEYDPTTGIFTWRARPLSHFRDAGRRQWWNGEFAGTVAGNNRSGRPPYWRLTFGNRTYGAHRIAWLLVYGEPVPDMLDHIDGDGLNNRIANLRAVTNGENRMNSRIRYNSTTGAKGITRMKRGFAARITFLGKCHYLGYFTTLNEAINARRDAAERLHGQFARHE